MKALLRYLMASSEYSEDELKAPSMTVIREIVFRGASVILPMTIILGAPFRWEYEGRVLIIVQVVLAVVTVGGSWLLLTRNIRIFSPMALLLMAFALLIAKILFSMHQFIYFGLAFPVAFYLLVDARKSLYLNLIWWIICGALAFSVLPRTDSINYIVSHGFACFFLAVLFYIMGRSEDQLMQLAVRDPLTNAFNRRAMNDAMEYAVMMHDRYNIASSIVMIDVDMFKDINDSFGHKEGDAVLKKMVNFLFARIRCTDKLCRYGGEEFVLVLTNTHRDDAFRLAESVRRQIRSTILTSRKQVTISCGVAESRPGDNVSDWLHRCDMALYKAKHEGRDRVELEVLGEVA